MEKFVEIFKSGQDYGVALVQPTANGSVQEVIGSVDGDAYHAGRRGGVVVTSGHSVEVSARFIYAAVAAERRELPAASAISFSFREAN